MRRPLSLVLLIAVFGAAVLSACSGTAQASGSAAAVEGYLKALVSQDSAQLSAHSCAAWEEQAKLELDSFQAVKASLNSLVCKETGKDGQASQVTCQGKIVATYNNENQEINLNTRVYKAVQESGEWRMCGYSK